MPTVLWTAILLNGSVLFGAATAPAGGYQIDAMPQGYNLQSYDDCGVLERQPHVQGTQTHTYSAGEVEADERARSVAWDGKQVRVVYDKLDPNVGYVLAVTYANEAYNNRTQSLWAGPVPLHGPRVLPKGKAERLLFRVPADAWTNGKLVLDFRLEGQVNVVVSAIELWAAVASPKALRLTGVSGLFTDLEGRVLNLAYDGLGSVKTQLSRAGDIAPLVTTQTSPDGSFRFERRLFERLPATDVLQIAATYDGATVKQAIPMSELIFEPVRYRPMAEQVAGLTSSQMRLDGVWKLNPVAADSVRSQPLNAPTWGEFRVPGQWVQQGYDIPANQPVAVATEFTPPGEWAGSRIFLRFDAIHAGTRYWVNGQLVGYSENLFTPVEWDITAAVRPGERNRLDLEMKVDTVSEQLSYSSGYAFHNLGGIDRSVRLYALPAIHVRSMRLITDLDDAYRDADLKLDLALLNTKPLKAGGLSLELGLSGPDGQAVSHSTPTVVVGELEPGSKTVHVTTHVANPLKWNAEKPNLYRLTLELKQGNALLERIERSIGFREIAIRDRQLVVNGQRVKLAGVCRHETDPLTGRADTMHHAEQDVKLLKSANLNHIRTSHYPPPQELLDAADRLGMYLEVEAPFCWVGAQWDMTHVKEVLVPTSAMIDYSHAHPSVLYWSLANESSFCKFFEASNKLCKDLDPTRPTTFNNPDPNRVCDIGNLHYPPMPYDDHVKSETRPFELGEYFYPVCHEQTDVGINPGLRELWAAGHSDPDSDWGRACAASFERPILLPGGRPGAWSHIYHSKSLIGGDIWAALDEPFYLPNGKKVGYAWVHGPWGLIDAWRRPKPELWLAKLMFSPVWFPARQVAFTPGQAAIRVPVENRYSFTDLSELAFAWELGDHKGTIAAKLAPASVGELEIPIPTGAKPGDAILLSVTDRQGELVNTLAIKLGASQPKPLPAPQAGPPKWHDDGKTIVIEGDPFGFVFDRSRGDFNAADPRHHAAMARYPALHVTRFDFGDLGGPSALPYAVLPDEKTRIVEGVAVRELPAGLEITVTDRYEQFAGHVTWLIDRRGMSEVSYAYTYLGESISVREVGLKLLAKPACDEIRWRRWSEWDIFPADHMSRTQGHAKARRDSQWPDTPENEKPAWPWPLDQTELGTNDFRACKFNIYEASLVAADGAGIRVHANADVHVRPCLAPHGVLLHILSRCRLGPVALNKNDPIAGRYIVECLSP